MAENAGTLEKLYHAHDDGQYDLVESLLDDAHPAEIADFLEGVSPEDRRQVWTLIPDQFLGETLTELSPQISSDLIESTERERLVKAIHELQIDDLADLIPDLPDSVVAEVLYEVDQDIRQGLKEVLAFDEDTAGGLMNVDFITVREGIKVGVALRYLRRIGEIPDHTDQLFVINRDNQFIGTVSINELITHSPATPLAAIVDVEAIQFEPQESEEDVALVFERYNLISAAVIGENGQLLGRITIDDIVDVIRQRGDAAQLAAAGLREGDDVFAPVLSTTRSRALWLGINLLTAIMASWVIGQFENTIGQFVALAVLMPIVPSMGGNAGTQTMATVIRGLGMGTIGAHNVGALIRKEVLVGTANGFLWAAIAAIVTIFWFQDTNLGLVMGIAMLANLIIASLSGVLIPYTFNRLGIDPSLSSGVILTTITDMLGFFAVLAVATAVLL